MIKTNCDVCKKELGFIIETEIFICEKCENFRITKEPSNCKKCDKFGCYHDEICPCDIENKK